LNVGFERLVQQRPILRNTTALPPGERAQMPISELETESHSGYRAHDYVAALSKRSAMWKTMNSGACDEDGYWPEAPVGIMAPVTLANPFDPSRCSRH
jgi:hypothetical protein